MQKAHVSAGFTTLILMEATQKFFKLFIKFVVDIYLM
jgi:hypothetical protein